MQRGESNELKSAISELLASEDITATPQSKLAIFEAIRNSPGEIAGDSDSLLLGLLMSGSYTVDAVELAGADPGRLRERAKESLVLPSNRYSSGEDAFFGSCSASRALLNYARDKGCLETADILRHAIAPISVDNDTWELRKTDSDSIVDQAVESTVIEALVEAYLDISRSPKYPEKEFQKRRAPLTAEEQETITECHSDSVAPYVMVAMNEWFVHRRVLTTPSAAVTEFVGASDGTFGFGSQLFLSTGGDYRALERNLQLAQRLNPERDTSAIVLCYREGRISAGEFTYRNSLTIDTAESRFPYQRLSVRAIRPVPLVASDVLEAFEALLSSDSLRELEIQAFLDQHPELITSFGGYTGAFPHLTLFEEGRHDLIPDYLLELPTGRGFDIVDLKLPKARLSAGSRYKRISSELQSAVAQLRKYRKYFDKVDNRKAFMSRYGLEPFRPEIVVVMGRSSEFSSLDDRREIEEQLGPARLLTYDDLLAFGQSRHVDINPSRAFG